MAPRKKEEAGTDLAVVEQREHKSVITDMANQFHMEAPAFEAALRATVVPANCTPAQFAAFLMVAKTYSLNPLTKEIYAFPSRGGGIVPIVSVDGWVNLVNSQGQCDGFTFEMEHDDKNNLVSCTCSMYRKDRKHPIVVTEYLSECVRSTEPWKMKHRMLRHKTLIQAARYAFGFSGIYDEDEGQKIAEIDPNKDAGPPRAAVASPQSTETIEGELVVEEVRDAAPPRRNAPQPPAEPPAAKAEPVAPLEDDDAPQPHQIPGKGHTFESWAEAFIDLVQTSPDTAVAYKWMDANRDPLDRLKKGKPSVSAKVDTAVKRLMEELRETQAKAEIKAAGNPEGVADMDDGPAKPEAGATDPESILKRIEEELAAVEDADQLQDVWENACEPLVGMLEFPPDIDLAQAAYRRHEQRLS